MIKCKSTDKLKDKQGRIIGYRLVDTNGKAMNIKSLALKEAIKLGQLEVINLTLTNNGRLIEKKYKTVTKSTQASRNTNTGNTKIQEILSRAKALGGSN